MSFILFFRNRWDRIGVRVSHVEDMTDEMKHRRTIQ